MTIHRKPRCGFCEVVLDLDVRSHAQRWHRILTDEKAEPFETEKMKEEMLALSTGFCSVRCSRRYAELRGDKL